MKMSNAVNWLMERLGIDPKKAVEDTDEGLELRLRIQKAAYFLGRLNVEPFTKYDFSHYIHGPYSPQLAKECYGEEPGHDVEPALTKEEGELLYWFMNHDSRWLEAATTLMLMADANPGITDDELFESIQHVKPWVDELMFDEVMKSLRAKNLFPRSLPEGGQVGANTSH